MKSRSAVKLKLVDAVSAAVAVAIDGLEHPFSFFCEYKEDSADTERMVLNGMFIACIAAGNTVNLRNKSATGIFC